MFHSNWFLCSWGCVCFGLRIVYGNFNYGSSTSKLQYSHQRTFDSRISLYNEKARSKAWSSMAQESPSTKHQNLTSVDTIDEKSETERERKIEWWVRDFRDCLNWKVCGYCLNWKVCFVGVGKNERKNKGMEALCWRKNLEWRDEENRKKEN